MNVLAYFKNIGVFVFDMDGVLTDGRLLLLADGQQARSMSIKDGYALQLAVKKGYRVLVISGSVSEPVRERLRKLGVTEVHMQVEDKQALLQNYMSQHALRPEEVLFMGDDIPDLAAMGIAGLPVCPADAVPDIQQAARYISPLRGGEGCVRDVIEKVLRARDDWAPVSGVRST